MTEIVRRSFFKASTFMKRYVWLLVLVLTSSTAFGESLPSFDWPQWQGPDRNGVSRERGLLAEWTEDGPPLAWRVNGLGGGYSAPTIAEGRVFGLSNLGDDEVVWALAETDGKTLWTTRLGPAFREGLPQGSEGPGSSPTVDGQRLYVLGSGGELACLQVDDGQIIWQVSLTRDLGGRVPGWRFNESPLVDRDLILCTPGGEETTLAALDKLTGELVWTSQLPVVDEGPVAPRPGRGGRGFGGRGGGRGGGSSAAYASAIAFDLAGTRQYVQFTHRALIGVAASDGTLLWSYDRPANRMGINCATPIHHDGFVLAASAYGTGGGLVKLAKDASGGITAEEVWFTRRMQNHHGGMIVHDGYLYGANGGNEGGNLICIDFKTGEVMWDGRELPRGVAPKGSIVLGDGRLYYRHESGTMTLVELNPERYIERGRFEQPDRSRSPAWSHPVLANGKLYLRDQDLLLSYDVRAE